MASKAYRAADPESIIRVEVMAALSAAEQPLSFFELIGQIEFPELPVMATYMPGSRDNRVVVTMRVLETMLGAHEIAELWNRERGEHTYRIDCSFSERIGL